MARVLKLLGNEVRTAHDGVEAIEAADEFRPEVILMDLGMPGLNGYEATRRIREPAVGEIGHHHRAHRLGPGGRPALSREAGCDGHLVKPVNLPDLENLLAELTGRETNHSQSV